MKYPPINQVDEQHQHSSNPVNLFVCQLSIRNNFPRLFLGIQRMKNNTIMVSGKDRDPQKTGEQEDGSRKD
jgi:hypothetical protein